MPFVRNDELFILMDMFGNSNHVLSTDELKKLRDAGIETCIWLGPDWQQWTSTKFATLNWKEFDDYRRRMEDAGMKYLIMCWQQNTKQYPADYYVKKDMQTRKFGTFSPWNPRAMEAYLESLRRVRDRETSETSQVVSGLLDGGGERVLLNVPAYFDDYALLDWRSKHAPNKYPDHRTPDGAEWLKEKYVQVMTDIMSVLIDTPHREIWYMLARYKATKPNMAGHGCEWVDDYLEAWKKLRPKAVNHISYNFFPYGEQFWNVIRNEKSRYKVNEFVGAEYCEGLRDGNGKKAISMGMRIIIAPKHVYTGHRRIDPWMIEVIKDTMDEYRSKVRRKASRK